MARALTPTILAALPSNRAGGAQPSVLLGATDIQRRMSLNGVIAGGGKGRSSAIITAAGALLRAAIPSANPGPQTLTLFRITDPAIFSQWQAAGTALDANANTDAGCALVQSGTAIRVFYVDQTSQSVYYRESTDDGLTWAPRVLVLAKPAGYVTCTGIAPISTTDLATTWYVYPQAAGGFFRTSFTTGWQPWATFAPGDPNAGQVRGWTCDPSQITKVFAAGLQRRAQRSGISAASATYAGSAWSPWATVHPMDTATNGLSLSYPAVHWDPTSRTWWLGVNLADDGSVSGAAQSRSLLFRSSDGLTWILTQSLYAGLWGEVHVLFVAGVQYVFDHQKLFTAPAGQALAGLEQDLLAIHIVEALGRPAQFTITLANTDGQYTNQPALTGNAEVDLYLGYNGSTIQTHACFIDATEFVAAPDRSLLIIHGRCIQKYLDQVQMLIATWSAQTIGAILSQLIPPIANLQPLPTTSQFSTPIPSFSVIPGQTVAQALTRLSQVFGFDYFTASTAGGAGLTMVERAAADPSTWTYYQEHLGLAWQHNADQPNVVRVAGAPPAGTYTNVFADAVDQANLSAAGVHRYQHIVDRLLDTSAKCQLKANLTLRDDQTQSQTASLTVTLNPQHELADVITINEPRLGLADQKARIDGITTSINWQTGQFFQQLSLTLP